MRLGSPLAPRTVEVEKDKVASGALQTCRILVTTKFEDVHLSLDFGRGLFYGRLINVGDREGGEKT